MWDLPRVLQSTPLMGLRVLAEVSPTIFQGCTRNGSDTTNVMARPTSDIVCSRPKPLRFLKRVSRGYEPSTYKPSISPVFCWCGICLGCYTTSYKGHVGVPKTFGVLCSKISFYTTRNTGHVKVHENFNMFCPEISIYMTWCEFTCLIWIPAS